MIRISFLLSQVEVHGTAIAPRVGEIESLGVWWRKGLTDCVAANEKKSLWVKGFSLNGLDNKLGHYLLLRKVILCTVVEWGLQSVFRCH